jgi:hypothetical protein
MAQTVITGLSLQRPSFKPMPIYLGFVVDKVALEQVFLGVLRMYINSIIPPILYI